ncbi:hypothetical protein ABPG77_010584 [Micractinium sp. CCAP 211/92]
MGKKQQPSKGKAVKGAKAAPRGGNDDGSSAADEPQQRKEKKQQRRRNQTHHYEGDDLERELAPLGLRVKTIEADGNCFFRSVSDQLEGEGGDHMALRCRVMDFIRDREEEYRFFIEDDEPFESYVRRMSKDGAWAGHLEVQAASLLLQRNISVYQAGQPVWHVRNFPDDAPTIHLSYHEGMHYNSVRNADDYGSGPPAPLRLGSAADLSAADPAALSAAQRSFGEREVARVLAGTGCADGARAARALEQCRGNVDEAIELLIEQMGEEEEEEEGGGASPAAAAPEAAAAQEDAASAREAQSAQQEAAPSGERQGAAAASAAERRQQVVSGPVSSNQQLLRDGGQRPEDWGRVRLELALDPDDPGGGARVALFPAGPQHAQHDQQEQGTQHASHDCITQEEAQGLGAGAAAAGGPVGSEEAGGKERASRKVARLKAKAVSHPGRNKPCPCGSKVKYKDCCARKDRRKAGSDSGAACAAAAVAAAQLKVLLI